MIAWVNIINCWRYICYSYVHTNHWNVSCAHSLLQDVHTCQTLTSNDLKVFSWTCLLYWYLPQKKKRKRKVNIFSFSMYGTLYSCNKCDIYTRTAVSRCPAALHTTHFLRMIRSILTFAPGVVMVAFLAVSTNTYSRNSLTETQWTQNSW